MPIGRLPLTRRVTTAVCAVAILLLSGCASVWWNSLLDPSQVGNFHENIVSEIQQTISFRDSPSGIPGATDPTPEDLVQTVEEYETGVGDQLSIRILDLLQRDVESEFRPIVDELGYIHVPQLGWIHVEGMTARELRSEIIQKLKESGLFRPEGGEPTVVIEFLLQQQRLYHIGGTIQSPGRYRINPPDFRLREAINQAGGLDPSVKTIYVFRNAPKPKRVIDRGVRTSPTAGEPSQDVPVPPVSPIGLSELAGGPAAPDTVGAGSPGSAQTSAPPSPSASPAPGASTPPSSPQPILLPTERELIEAVEPESATPAPAAPPQASPTVRTQGTPPQPGRHPRPHEPLRSSSSTRASSRWNPRPLRRPSNHGHKRPPLPPLRPLEPLIPWTGRS